MERGPKGSSSHLGALEQDPGRRQWHDVGERQRGGIALAGFLGDAGAVDHGDGMALLGQQCRRGDTDDAGADNDNSFGGVAHASTELARAFLRSASIC